jgi:hypothetical protein
MDKEGERFYSLANKFFTPKTSHQLSQKVCGLDGFGTAEVVQGTAPQ